MQAHVEMVGSEELTHSTSQEEPSVSKTDSDITEKPVSWLERLKCLIPLLLSII